MSERIIIWESYHFEFQGDIEQEEEHEYDPDDDEFGKIAKNLPKIANTPFGLFQMDDTLNPFKRFEFWMGHTNFNLTEECRDKLDLIEGVEIVLVCTRYRFIVGIGKAFEFAKVRQAIQESLCVNGSELDILKKQVRKFKYWAIFEGVDGIIEHAVADIETNEFLEKIKYFKTLETENLGKLICSENFDDNKK